MGGQPPGDGPPPTPRHAAPTGHAGQKDSVGPPHPHTRAHSTWVADPNSPPSGRAVEGGTAPDLRRPSRLWKAPPPGTPFRHPRSEQCRPARAHAVGPVLGLHARTDRTRDTRVVEPRLPASEDGRPGEGQRLTPDPPHNVGRPTPPGDGPPPPPQHAAPTGHAGQGDSVGPPHPHPRAHSRWVADPNSPLSGCAVEGGTAPDLRRPSQWWKAPPPGTPFRHPHSEQCLPARAHAVGPVLGPHARTDRTRDTRVVEPRLPAPEDGRPGQGQRLTPDAPHNVGRPTPPGDGPPPPPRHAAPTGHAGQEDSVGPPHPHTRAHSRWAADPNSPPSRWAVEGGQRLTSDAPRNGGRHPPGDALPPPPQRATPARKGARCGAGAGSPRPNRPHLGHTGHGTLAARSRGRAAGGGTAPDTRRPSQRWQATAPWDGPPPAPRHAASTGHTGQGDTVGPPHPHTRAHSTWVAGPNSPPSGRAVGGGTVPVLRRPSPWWKAPPLGTLFRHPHSEQRRPARAHAVGPVLAPHARTDRTPDTRVAEPWLPAPEDGRPGEGQRLTPDAPHNGGRPPPPGTAPPPAPRHAAPTGHASQGDSVGPQHAHTRARSTWVVDPNSPPSGRAVGGGTAPDLRRPSQWWNAPPPGTPFCQLHSEQRQPARAHAVGQVLAPHARTDRTRDTRVAEPRPPAPEDGRPGEGQRLTPDAPHNGGRPPSPGDGPPPPPRHAAPTGHAGREDSVGPPHTHTRAYSTWVADPNSPPSGRAVGGGTAPDLRRPSQWWKSAPPGTPFRHPGSEQRGPAMAHALGPVLGPHARTNCTRDTRVAEPWLPAPEDGRPGKGQRLTPDAPHNGGRPPPPGDGPPPPPRHAAPTGHAGQRRQCWAPTPTHPRPQHVGGGPQQPAQWAGSRGRDSA